MKRKQALLACAVLLVLGSVQFAAAQNFNQTIVFGDSTEDTGFFALTSTNNAAFNAAIAAAIAAGGNAHFTGPGPNYTQILAGIFGTTANTNKAPGGTNYAIGGAFDDGYFDLAFGAGHENLITLVIGPEANLLGTTEQIAEYLASTGGHANPNALYLIASGGNDIFAVLGLGLNPTQTTAVFNFEARALASGVAGLQTAGARYIVVTDENPIAPFVAPPAVVAALGQQLFSATWTDLAAAGVKFIPADTFSVIAAVQANPAAFGITAPLNSPACVLSPALQTALIPVGLNASGYGAVCAPTTTPSNSYGYLVSANALQTHLYMDGVHLTEAGQQMIADYIYSLIVAPSEISFLAETAIQSTFAMITGIQQQIDLSQRQRPPGWNVWINGDLSYLQMNNSSAGFPNDPGIPISGTMGVDYHWANGWLVGAAVTEGWVNPTFSLGGGYTQNEAALSLYTAYRNNDWWGNLIGSAGWLNYNTNRTVPIGITVQPNNGSTSGADLSLAGELGYDFHTGFITHGPVAGFILQQVWVGGFTETGSFTSLSFGSQILNSEVSVLGYQANFDWGPWHPFAQLVWDHEFAPLNRMVTASLTTMAAPSYSMPAVVPGRDWATATVGTEFKINGSWSALASFTAQVGQDTVTNYGGLVGLNYAFGQAAPPSPIVYKN